MDTPREILASPAARLSFCSSIRPGMRDGPTWRVTPADAAWRSGCRFGAEGGRICRPTSPLRNLRSLEAICLPSSSSSTGQLRITRSFTLGCPINLFSFKLSVVRLGRRLRTCSILESSDGSSAFPSGSAPPLCSALREVGLGSSWSPSSLRERSRDIKPDSTTSGSMCETRSLLFERSSVSKPFASVYRLSSSKLSGDRRPGSSADSLITLGTRCPLSRSSLRLLAVCRPSTTLMQLPPRKSCTSEAGATKLPRSEISLFWAKRCVSSLRLSIPLSEVRLLS
mmetsp:Transcript_20002/g.47933  ORF Transcript_20002/g.47933 Transcript_20002/m.47933 type:complete len:283 (+) Transcript_20002:255-1103(+)